MSPQAGYSGTPLAKKLGIKPSCRLCAMAAPGGYRGLLEPMPEGVRFQRRPGPDTDIVHLFVTRAEDLRDRLTMLRGLLGPDVAVWVSWPKKASKVPTTVTEDVIRQVALPLGFVDVKVCAIDEVWSGLRLVVRRALR